MDAAFAQWRHHMVFKGACNQATITAAIAHLRGTHTLSPYCFERQWHS